MERKRIIDLLSIVDPKEFADTLDRPTEKPKIPTMRLVFIPDILDRNKISAIDRIHSTAWLRGEGEPIKDMLNNLKPSGIGWKGSYDRDSLEVYTNGAVRLSLCEPARFFEEPPPECVLNTIAVVQYPVLFLRFVKLLLNQESFDCGGTVEMIYYNMSGVILRPRRPDHPGHDVAGSNQDSGHLIYQHHLEPDFNPYIEARALLTRFYADFGYEADMMPPTEGAEAT